MATEEQTATPAQQTATAIPSQPSPPSSFPNMTGTTDDKSGPKTPTSINLDDASPKHSEPSPSQMPEGESGREGNKRSHIDRVNSQRSAKSNTSGDVDMDDDEEGDDGSDNESVTSDTNRPSKKKKGQRFFCTDYPPCKLSFTRSEHLARHIRKHTGERPFQCHCLRKFSRLDNLRQHAQTVHVNEEIPGDSLAATGTRFQRQIRTDRMRTPGNRNRAATVGGQPPYSRGHSRNVSGSSISSIPSDIGSPDATRRPQPLAPNTPRGSVSVDTTYSMNGSPQSFYGPFYNQSPSGYSTPTSVFSGDPSSPREAPRLQSPVSIVGRSLTWGGGRVPNRRLSVPSGPNPFQPNPAYPPPNAAYMSPPSNGAAQFSNNSSVLGSPTSSVFSSDTRVAYTNEPDPRRRTWHPSTYTGYSNRPATSSLSYYQTPDAPQPVNATQPAAAQAVRLPGIDSFDRAHGQPLAPPRRLPSPMEVDLPSRKDSIHEHRGHRDSWGSMDHNLNRLDLSQPPAQEQSANVDPAPPPIPSHQTTQLPRKPVPPPLNLVNDLSSEPGPEVTDEPITPKKKKRQAWYNGPISNPTEPQPAATTHRTSPEGSSSSEGIPTPSTASAADYYPAIRHSNGFVETRPPGLPIDDSQKPAANARPDPSGHPIHNFGPPVSAPLAQHRATSGTDRLDALVAVATSEDQAMMS